MVLTLVFGWAKDKWVLTIIFLIMEMIILAYLVSNYFPGGREGVTKSLKFTFEKIKGCCLGLCGKKKEKSLADSAMDAVLK